MSDEPDPVLAARGPGGAVHRGMVWLLRTEPRWLIDVLVDRKLLPPGRHLEVLPTEGWPVGEANRVREIRADLVIRLWPFPPPESPSLALIQRSDVIGLLGDFQNHRDPDKERRIVDYPSVYGSILGRQILFAPMTFEERVAQWMRTTASRLSSMRSFVLTPRWIRRGPRLDPDTLPRQVLLDAMIHVRGARDLSLLTDALRALRWFEGNELLIYREMLLSRMHRSLIMQAHHQLADEGIDPSWADYVPTARERKSFLYVTGLEDGVEKGKIEGKIEGKVEGKVEGRARSVLDILRVRGFVLDEARQARILACTDEARLVALLEHAVAIASLEVLDELLDGTPPA